MKNKTETHNTKIRGRVGGNCVKPRGQALQPGCAIARTYDPDSSGCRTSASGAGLWR